MVGYRRWRYTIAPAGATLFPLNHFDMEPFGRSPWAGAESRWVVARCSVELRGPSRTQLQALRDLLAETPGDEATIAAETPPHEVPVETCTCGFYAMRVLTPELLGPRAWSPNQGDTGSVLGRVLLAGKVIEHDSGFRAERARVVELIPMKGTERSVMRLADKLDLPMGRAVGYV